jgi:hypothetical protein
VVALRSEPRSEGYTEQRRGIEVLLVQQAAGGVLDPQLTAYNHTGVEMQRHLLPEFARHAHEHRHIALLADAVWHGTGLAQAKAREPYRPAGNPAVPNYYVARRPEGVQAGPTR